MVQLQSGFVHESLLESQNDTITAEKTCSPARQPWRTSQFTPALHAMPRCLAPETTPIRISEPIDYITRETA